MRYIEYREDFLEILKSSDLFITGKDFPDLGYVEMEAGILGIPIAKFVSRINEEEIIHGKTGILARDESEMVKLLTDYIFNIDYNKKYLGENLKKYITENKNWKVIINKWNNLFRKLKFRKK